MLHPTPTPHEFSIGDDPVLASRYEIEEEIGSGGFAAVYSAVQSTTGQQVAVKVLRLDPAGSEPVEDQLDRFRREAGLCARLHHPNIVPLIDFGETASGLLYAVFAFVPGWNLGEVLAAEGALDPAEAVHLMTQVLDALGSAHAEGIVHRDLKPGNIMVNPSGARRNAMILDFGIGTVVDDARLRDLRRVTRGGVFLGTPLYSAPEQLRGEPPTLRSDLYAWGLVLLECLTGESPFGAAPHEMVHALLSPEPVSIPSVLHDCELGRILAQATEKDAARRTASAREILSALQRCAGDALPSREELTSLRRGSRFGDVSETVPRRPRSGSGLSPIWLVPLGRNPNFTGREALLREVADSLASEKLLAVVALHGLGGVGKTQLALEYAYRYAGSYRVVAWLRAEEPETLTADYVALAHALQLPEDASNPRQAVQAVRGWLEQNNRWLLVFDNAPNPEALRAFLPRTHAGHILVTSRRKSWRELAASLPVDVLDLREATELMTRRVGERTSETAQELCEELGCLPLALDEAAAYMEATGRSIESYLRLLREHRREILRGDPHSPSSRSPVLSTWELSFRELEHEAKSASQLLVLCSFLSPEDLPRSLLVRGKEHLPEPLASAARDEVSLDFCVAELSRYSLVKAERDCLSMHRLVQLATRDRLADDQRERWTATALRVVEAAYPHGTTAPATDPDSARLLPHAIAVLSHAAPFTASPATAARLIQRTAVYNGATGRFDLVCRDLERAAELLERSGEANERDLAVLLWQVGMVHFAYGELPPAREALERAVKVFERSGSAANLNLSQVSLTLAWVLRALGDFEAALAAARRSFELAEQVLGKAHPFLSMSSSLMGRACWGLGRVAEARDFMERSLQAIGQERGKLHPFMAGTWNNLAQLRLDLGDVEGALACTERGLEIDESAWGRDHPFLCIALTVRGAALARRGDLETARGCFERALESGQRTCGDLHEDIEIARSALGDTLRLLGDLDGARSTLEYALDASGRACGDTTRCRSHARFAYAALLRDLRDFQAARSHAEAGLDVLASGLTSGHPLAIPGLNLLGWIHRDLADAAAAEQCFAQAIAIADRNGLVNHPDYGESLEGAGTLQLDAGETERARDALSRALGVTERGRGDKHPIAIRIRERLDAIRQPS